MWPSPSRLRQWWLNRLPCETSCTLTQRRIYLLPTRFGWTLLLVAAAIWLGALNYAVSLAYALAFWLVALLLVAVLMAYRQLAGLQLAPLPSEPVFAGETMPCTLRIKDTQGLGRAIWLGLATLRGGDVPGHLSPHGELLLSLPVPMPQRGLWPYPLMTVWSEAPFGLVRAFAYLRFSANLLVYPAPLEDVTDNQVSAQQGQGEGASPSGHDDFSHLQAYQQGDAPRHIAWNVLARRDVLVSKRFVGASAASLQQLSWQDYPPTLDDEARLSRLCWRVLRCEQQGLRYVLQLPNEIIDSAAAAPGQALQALALHEDAT